MKTKETFCANCQAITLQQVIIDENGEFLITCDCGRFFKLAGDLDADQIAQALVAHQVSNEGQVSQAEIEAVNEEKLNLI